MAQKFYRTTGGYYVGSYDGLVGPGQDGFPYAADVVEVASPPLDRRLVWNGSIWVDANGTVLAAAKAEKRAQLDEYFEAQMAAGVTYPTWGKAVQLRDEDQGRIASMKMIADMAAASQMAWPSFFTSNGWRTADNSYVAIATPADGIAMALWAVGKVLQWREALFTQKDLVDAQTTLTDINNYPVDQGWPT